MNSTFANVTVNNGTLGNSTQSSPFDDFNRLLSQYPIPVVVLCSVLLAVFVIIAILLTIIAIGHRAYLVLGCYKILPKGVKESRVSRQLWLHVLYCYMVVYCIYKVFNFAFMIYRASDGRLGIRDFSFIAVDLMLYDITIAIMIQIFLVVLSSASFTTFRKVCIVVARILLVLSVFVGVAYSVISIVVYNIYMNISSDTFTILIQGTAIPLVAINKVGLTLLVIITGIVMYMNIREGGGKGNSRTKALIRRLLFIMVLTIFATIIVSGCLAVLLSINNIGIVFVLLVTMGVPDFVVFLVMTIIFWPTRFSLKRFRKNAMSENGIETITNSDGEQSGPDLEGDISVVDETTQPNMPSSAETPKEIEASGDDSAPEQEKQNV
ncbi:hypothetical protein AKO1_010466 [Acrasis kona]|uniref:Uncharacterized protein n=1 Tax=Acrasis kona TaxID=1008807 RepID=A0AAW2ZKN5_9EUKA